MVTFSQVVAQSRDAQLLQAERERTDRAFMEDVMDTVREQVEAEGGSLSVQGEWVRLNENASNSYVVVFPGGCNVSQVGLTVAGRKASKDYVFLVGASIHGTEAHTVADRSEGAAQVFDYLMQVVGEIRQMHDR